MRCDVRFFGCEGDVNATAEFVWYSREWNKSPKLRRFELTIRPLVFGCNHCGAAPGWGCVIRHSRRRAMLLKRTHSPLHTRPNTHSRLVGAVAVHEDRWKRAISAELIERGLTSCK